MRFTEWRKLEVSLVELCIDTSLRCGQSFRWRRSTDGEWSCALQGRILTLRQDSTHLHYRAIYPAGPSSSLVALDVSHLTGSTDSVRHDADDSSTTALVRHYLNLEPKLTSLYEQWSTADANFKKKSVKFAGVRILRQDPWEALVGFICSSNNNIVRISQMVEKLCIHYGPLVGYLGGRAYHDMPAPAVLADASVEPKLRQLGFGYRAKYLHQTAAVIANDRPVGWLDSLRNPETQPAELAPTLASELPASGREGYRHAHQQILELQGVGPKVADCVCLMGLGWGEAVPVDTHVWQIAQRDYKFGRGKHKTLTKATYDAVGDYFRQLWGRDAGWAHSVLFTADLKAFSDRLSDGVVAAKTVETPDAASTLELKLEQPDEAVALKVETRSTRTKKRKFASQETGHTTTSTSTTTTASTTDVLPNSPRRSRRRTTQAASTA